MLKISAKIFVFVSILFVSNQALAGRVAALYDVEISVADESAATRNQAFERGLDEVFVRISGNSIVMDKLERPPSSRYVKQFSYEPITIPSADGAAAKYDAEMKHRLKIHYNGSLMEKYLLENGFAAWGQYRPDVVVWLVVRDGRNEYVLKDSDSSLIKKAAAEALVRRGIPGRWPLYDKKDRKILNVADIRGGFKEPVKKASQRYGRGPALTGSMIWNGRQWQSSWGLLVDGENRHWTVDETDHRRLVNKAIDQAADMLGVVFAVNNVTDKQQLDTIHLHVQAVDSVEKYRQLENYLTALSVVESVIPLKVDGQNAVFEVLLRSKKEDFLSLVRNAAELTEVRVQTVKKTLVKTPEVKTEEVKIREITNQAVTPVDSANAITKDATIDAAAAEKELAHEVTQAAVAGQAVAETAVEPQPIIQIPVYYYRFNQQ